MSIEDRSVTTLNEAVCAAASVLPRWVPRRVRLRWARGIVGALWLKWRQNPPPAEIRSSTESHPHGHSEPYRIEMSAAGVWCSICGWTT